MGPIHWFQGDTRLAVLAGNGNVFRRRRRVAEPPAERGAVALARLSVWKARPSSGRQARLGDDEQPPCPGPACARAAAAPARRACPRTAAPRTAPCAGGPSNARRAHRRDALGLTTTAQWSSSYATTSFGVSAGYGSKTRVCCCARAEESRVASRARAGSARRGARARCPLRPPPPRLGARPSSPPPSGTAGNAASVASARFHFRPRRRRSRSGRPPRRPPRGPRRTRPPRATKASPSTRPLGGDVGGAPGPQRPRPRRDARSARSTRQGNALRGLRRAPRASAAKYTSHERVWCRSLRSDDFLLAFPRHAKGVVVERAFSVFQWLWLLQTKCPYVSPAHTLVLTERADHELLTRAFPTAQPLRRAAR